MDIYLGDDCHWHVLKLSDREVANESFHTLRDAVQGYDADGIHNVPIMYRRYCTDHPSQKPLKPLVSLRFNMMVPTAGLEPNPPTIMRLAQ